jgi:hypothetical protein
LKRAAHRARLVCSACHDKGPGVELTTLSVVVKAGGPELLALCLDCVGELITVCQRNVNASANASVNAGSTQRPTQGQRKVNATENATINGYVSGSDSDLSLLPLEASDPERARVEPKYSAEFEAFWAQCQGKKGNKWPAFKHFQRLKPPVALTVQRWNLWMATTQWQRGYSKHMEGWLNARGWENEPDPSEFDNAPSTLPAKVAASRATVTAWAKGTG